MVGGRGVKLAPTSGVTDSELFLCIDVDAGQAESVVRQASAVDRDWLPAEKITTAVEVAFDPAAERVVARKRTRFEDLILDDLPAALPASEEVARVLVVAAADQWERIKPAADSPAGHYLVRINCLRQWMPELNCRHSRRPNCGNCCRIWLLSRNHSRTFAPPIGWAASRAG